MLTLLVNLSCSDLLKNAVIEGQVHVEGDAVETLQAEVQLIKEQLGLLVECTDKGVALVEAQKNVKRPFKLGEPDVKIRHVQKPDYKA